MKDIEMDVEFCEKDNCYKILIVEDNDADLLLLKKQLQKIWPNSRTLAAKSVQDAYLAYKNNSVDLVLLDLNLPDGYGPSTVKEVRKFYKSAPIIVITGIGTSLTVSESLRFGANNVVLKSQIYNADFVNVLEQNVLH